jgi:predicted AAA+ superfamily ATPase
MQQVGKRLAAKYGKESLLSIELDKMEYTDVRDAQELKSLLQQRLNDGVRYILLDEIQLVDGWERIVNALFAEMRYDLYITGSNSRLLSGELRTLLSGRTVSFGVQPFTFAEYMRYVDGGSFDDYLTLGGFPAIHAGNFSGEAARRFLDDIYSSIILKDVVERHNIRNVDLLGRIVRFAVSNIGSLFSAQSIHRYFKAEHRRADPETIYSYISYLEEAFILSRVSRYDIQGKEELKFNEKFYLPCHSLVGVFYDDTSRFVQSMLENIVYNELTYRGYTASVGIHGEQEVDFVASRRDAKLFIQVSYLMPEQTTLQRELLPLQKINTAHPRIILTMDKSRLGSYDGISCVYLPDWLLVQ